MQLLKTFRPFAWLLACVVLVVLVSQTRATTRYFDVNGTVANSGVTAAGVGTRAISTGIIWMGSTLRPATN